MLVGLTGGALASANKQFTSQKETAMAWNTLREYELFDLPVCIPNLSD